MAKHFGQLMWLKGVTYYTLSPNELRPFSGMLNPGFRNTIRRLRENILYIGIPFAASYSMYDWATKKHNTLARKNPEDYKSDE